MPITRMDHFNIITDDLAATLAFYAEHLNLKPRGRRSSSRGPGCTPTAAAARTRSCTSSPARTASSW